jgi:hypothetical protein
MVGELVVRVGLTLGSFASFESSLGWSGHSVEGHRLVLRVLNFVKVHMRHFVVSDKARIVRRCVAWEFGEVL